MTTVLPKLLEFGFAGPNQRKRMLNSAQFKKMLEGRKAYDASGKCLGDAYKFLMESEATAISDSTLVQEEVYKTVIEGAEPIKCFREAVPIIKTDSYSVRFIKGESGSYASKIPEGGAIEIDTQTYSKQDVTIEKYGTRPLITNELIEDGLFDVVELELKKAGQRMENTLNREMLNTILTNVTTNTLSPASTHIAVSDIATAVGKVKKSNYIPDILITHPTAEGYLMSDSNLAYIAYAGTPDTLRGGNLGSRLLGLKPYTCTATDADSSPVWDDTNAGSDVTALVYSKNDLGVIAMRRDITIERYDDPIHDLVGISVTMRFGTGVLRETAGCKIFHK